MVARSGENALHRRNPSALIAPTAPGHLALVEAKATRTALPRMADPLDRLARAASRYTVSRFVVQRPSAKESRFTGLDAGARAVGIQEFIALLERSR